MARVSRRGPRRPDSSSSSSSEPDSASASSVARARRANTSSNRGAMAFVKRTLRIAFQLCCTLLLAMTVFSIVLAVGSLQASTAYELAQYGRHALQTMDYRHLTLALLGGAAYLLFVVFTLLAGLMLIPALWVSVTDIVGLPWNLSFLDSIP